MARARNIKPSFFINEELVELSFATRLLFIGLWTIADRAGRLEDKPKKIKMALFPADDLNIDEALNELQSSGFIKRYSVDEVKYIQILAFEKHQNPHIKEPSSTIPAPCEHHASTMLATLIPDSPLPITDSLIPESINTKTAPPTAAASVCLALSKLGYSDINPANPTLLKLLEAGATVEEFEGAAKTSSVRTFSYVLRIVKRQREQAAKIEPEKLKKAEKPWYITSTGIEDKGREIGLVHDPSEAFPYFKARVYKAHGITDEMLRKANIDWGSG